MRHRPRRVPHRVQSSAPGRCSRSRTSSTRRRRIMLQVSTRSTMWPAVRQPTRSRTPPRAVRRARLPSSAGHARPVQASDVATAKTEPAIGSAAATQRKTLVAAGRSIHPDLSCPGRGLRGREGADGACGDFCRGNPLTAPTTGQRAVGVWGSGAGRGPRPGFVGGVWWPSVGQSHLPASPSGAGAVCGEPAGTLSQRAARQYIRSCTHVLLSLCRCQ